MPAFCNWCTLRELFKYIVSPLTGVMMEASVNGDLLDETMVQVLDGSVISVYLFEGFNEAIQNDLQKFLDRQVNFFLILQLGIFWCLMTLKLAGMKCALLTTHILEHTMTAGFYCSARASRLHLIDISSQDKEWVLYPNLHRVSDESFNVEHGDFFALCEKVSRKGRPYSFPASCAHRMSHRLITVGLDSYSSQGYSEQCLPCSSSYPFGSSLRHRLTSPSVSAGPDNQEQYDSLAAYARGPEHSLRCERINAYDSACVRNHNGPNPFN